MNDGCVSIVFGFITGLLFWTGFYVGKYTGSKQANVTYYSKHYNEFELLIKKVKFEKEQFDKRKEFEATLDNKSN